MNLNPFAPLFIINHSGGKDSQAMYLYLTKELEVPLIRIKVIHAELPGVDWEGSVDHIKNTIKTNLILCRADKTFFDMVRRRQKFPSAKHRQCTSDLKRDPIHKQVRRISREESEPFIINCMGIRAQESPARAKKNPWKQNVRLSKAGREVIDWLPIFEWTQDQVFDIIKEFGQKPFWTYARGMTRKSCKFCILASKSDLCTASKIDPTAYGEMVELEAEIGFTFKNKKSLSEFIK